MKRQEEEEKRKGKMSDLIYIDWDLIMSKIDELQVSQEEADEIKKAILHKEGESLRLKRQKMNIREFESLAIIGKGAFGEVRICKYHHTGEIVAIKKMKKEEMHKKNQVLHVRAERDVLSEAKNPWIVDLKYSFQDEVYLYLVMEFLPGGDLMSLLMTKDILSEDESRFYAAELVLSIESVHKLKCIHRDLKPDNVLIDRDGHIKLSDFGLSKKFDINLYDFEQINGNGENNNNANLNGLLLKNTKDLNSFSKNRKKRIYAFSTVGTPDYIAPEVFSQKGYGPEVDWWSLGVILFEMLIGYPPFFSDSATETCKKILNWKTNLVIPPETKISKEAIDLIKRLITDVDKRLGYHGADELKKHPFFRNVNWNNISSLTPPFIPEISSEWDAKYFDHFDEDEPFYPPETTQNKKVNKDVCFVNFTYKREMDNQKSSIINALEVLDSLKDSVRKADRECNDNDYNYCFQGNANKNNSCYNDNAKIENGGGNFKNEIKNSVIYTGLEEEEILSKNYSSKSKQNIPNYNVNVNAFNSNLITANNIVSPKNNFDNFPNGNIQKEDNSKTPLHKNILSPKESVKHNSVYKKLNSNPNANNTPENYFSAKSNSTNSNSNTKNGTLSNGNNVFEKASGVVSGSDFLLKSNHDLEKKLKLTKPKTTNIMSPLSSNSKTQLKKINPISNNNNNYNVPFTNEVPSNSNYNSYSNNSNKFLTKKSTSIKIETQENLSNTQEEFKFNTNNTNSANTMIMNPSFNAISTNNKKSNNDKTAKINFNYNTNDIKKEVKHGSNYNITNCGSGFITNNNQTNSLITTNYLKDFIHSESINSNKGRDSVANKNPSTFKFPNSQLKANPNKEVVSNPSKVSNDITKPLSTKSSATKKIVFGSNNNAVTNNYGVNSNTNLNSNIPTNSNNPSKFVKMKDVSLQNQRISNDKFPKIKK